MTKAGKIIQQMQAAPQNVRYDDLVKVCDEHFGQPRQKGTSHAVYKTPWAGDPRVNIQRGNGGLAKTYQVRQVLRAIDKLVAGADEANEETENRETKDEEDDGHA